MAVADDCGYTGQLPEFLRRSLGVAAGDDDLGRWIFAMCAADKGTGGTIGFGRYAASVNDDDIGGKRLAFGKRPQMSGNGLAIRARRPAAEVLDGKTRHCPSLVGFSVRRDSQGMGTAI
jgi:hypothetical protein